MKILGIAAAAAALLAFAGFVYVANMLGHSLYVVEGDAVVRSDAVSRAMLPALVCSGHGGPLDSSGVQGQTLGTAEHASAQVVCTDEMAPYAFPYEESVYYGSLPKNMHVYVWLEHRPELLPLCQQAGEPIVSIDSASIRGNGGELWERPCGQGPAVEGPLGYAVTFRTEMPDDHESARIDVTASGFP